MTATMPNPTTSTLPLLGALMRAYAGRDAVETIAVVGNMPLAPSPERAREIDAADLVIRANGYRTDVGGESAAGTRTDVVVFNRLVRATPWLYAGYRSRLFLMVEPGRLYGEGPEIPSHWPTDLGFVTLSNADVLVPACRDIGIDVFAEPKWPTTGTLAAWLAVTLFPEAEVRLAGYSFLDNPAQTSWDHAVGESSPVGREHLIDREGELMRRWMQDTRRVVRSI